MKLLFLIVFSTICMTGASANIDSLFQVANEHYQEGAYEGALESYREIINDGFESPELYHNMGNAAYRSNNIGYAILYYEKALKLNPRYEDARHNLEFVSQYRIDTFKEVPRLFIWNWISALVRLFSERTWSIIAFVSFLIFILSILLYLFSRHLSLKKTGFALALTGIIIWMVTFAAARAGSSSITKPDSGIILSPSVTVRSSPSESGTELFILHEGSRVGINEHVSGWQNIRVVDGREGWIRMEDFETI